MTRARVEHGLARCDARKKLPSHLRFSRALIWAKDHKVPDPRRQSQRGGGCRKVHLWGPLKVASREERRMWAKLTACQSRANTTMRETFGVCLGNTAECRLGRVQARCRSVARGHALAVNISARCGGSSPPDCSQQRTVGLLHTSWSWR